MIELDGLSHADPSSFVDFLVDHVCQRLTRSDFLQALFLISQNGNAGNLKDSRIPLLKGDRSTSARRQRPAHPFQAAHRFYWNGSPIKQSNAYLLIILGKFIAPVGING